jgi:hypothetical protein
MMTVATVPDRSATRMAEDADFFGSVSREVRAGDEQCGLREKPGEPGGV